MRVLHIISSGGMYGAESVILNMSRTLNEDGHRSILGVFSNSANPNLQLHERAKMEGIESHVIPCEGQIDRRVIAKIQELTAATGADVIHAHGYKADVYVYLALRRQRKPFVSTCHNWLTQNLIVSLYGIVDRFVLRKYAGVVAVSAEVKHRLLKAGVGGEKIHLIRNGIDLRPFEAAPASLREDERLAAALVVGWVGRLSREKGADIFLRAAARVVVEFPQARFVLVGDGPDKDALGSLAEELNIQEDVLLLGRRDDMPSVYASLDVMVSSSRQEGLPMAILEGMATGLPLVATAVGEVPTLVLDGRTGVLVPAEDVDLLVAGIIELLRDPAKRTRFGAAGRQLIYDEFSAGRMTEEYLRVYGEVIAAVKEGRESSAEPSAASQGNAK
jgi:glycosyltransferase involved in cell wall biosynthesis